MNDEISQTAVVPTDSETVTEDESVLLGKRTSTQSAIEPKGSRKASIVDFGDGPEPYDEVARGFSEEVIDEASEGDEDEVRDDGGLVIGAITGDCCYSKVFVDDRPVYVVVCSSCDKPQVEAFSRDDFDKWGQLRHKTRWGFSACDCAESYGALGDGTLDGGADDEGIFRSDELDRLLRDDDDLRQRFLDYLGELAVQQDMDNN